MFPFFGQQDVFFKLAFWFSNTKQFLMFIFCIDFVIQNLCCASSGILPSFLAFIFLLERFLLGKDDLLYLFQFLTLT